MTSPASLFIQGPAGRLDARQHGPSDGAPVLLLHPHPRFGGTMGSRFVHDLAEGLATAGCRVTRFNFRGVGRSEGTYAHGVGEAQDAAAAFDALAAAAGAPPAVVGYSFGGAVACRLATMRRIDRLVLVGTPLRVTESDLEPCNDAPAAQGEPQVLVVVGDRDGFVTPPEAARLAATFPTPGITRVLPGAGHFLEPSHNAAGVAAVRYWLASTPAGLP